MADDTTADGTATGADDGTGASNGAAIDAQLRQAAGNGAVQPQAPANPVFREPVAGHAASGESETAQDRDSDAEQLLADAVAAGDGDEKATGKDELAAAKAELAKWKAQARENEKRAKANADKAKSYDEYTEAQKTEQQRLADRASAAEKRAAEAESRYHRTLAAATYDLPPSMIDQLGDGTEEEITARAELLAAAINERAAVLAQANGNKNGASTTGRPVESLRPGALPAGDSKPGDPNAWFRGMLASSKRQ